MPSTISYSECAEAVNMRRTSNAWRSDPAMLVASNVHPQRGADQNLLAYDALNRPQIVPVPASRAPDLSTNTRSKRVTNAEI